VRRAALALAAAAVVQVSGCRDRPAAGGKCRLVDQLVCAGTDRALVCQAGSGGTAWVEVLCKGSQGCSRRADVDECDDTVATRDDACPRNPPLDYACSPDHAEALVCKEGRFTLWRACRGSEGCQVDGRNVRCDTTLGEPGDPCAQQGTYACSADARTMLQCDGAVLAPASSCRGPLGCRVDRATRKVDCDDAVVLEGDPCDQPKRIACAADGKAELSCQGGKYVKKRDCRRSDCRLDGTALFCD
jgi:hypothetical protein